MKKITVQENPKKNRLRVYDEDPKTRQTIHWDLDYMPNEEIEALFEKGRLKSKYWRKVRIIGLILGSVFLTLIVLVFVYSYYPH
jgi:hypothetical protein